MDGPARIEGLLVDVCGDDVEIKLYGPVDASDPDAVYGELVAHVRMRRGDVRRWIRALEMFS